MPPLDLILHYFLITLAVIGIIVLIVFTIAGIIIVKVAKEIEFKDEENHY